VREEDGLNLDTVYTFQVRVGDTYQMGPWSDSSKPYHFHVPPPAPPQVSCGGETESPGISVTTGETSVVLKWPAFVPQATGVEKWAGLEHLAVEYTVTIFCSGLNEPILTLMTQDTQVTAHALTPSTSYSAKLSARWARFGSSEATVNRGGLMCCFITALSSTRMVAEITAIMPNDRMLGGQPQQFVHVPLPKAGEDGGISADINLNPYYGGGHMQPAFVRKPPRPGKPVGYPEDPDGGERQVPSTAPLLTGNGTPRQLPSVAIPPKFVPRDPMETLKALAFMPPRPPGSRPVRSRRPQSVGAPGGMFDL